MVSDNERSKPTLKDIAKATGFSVNTVSRALRGMSDISDATQKRIQDYARSIGYYSNSLASSLRLGYTSTIALIVPDVSNPYFSILTQGVEEYARKHGYTTIVINTNEDEKLEKVAIEIALSKSVDGILLCPTEKSVRNVEFLQKTGVPFVLSGRYFQEIATDYVTMDDVLGGYLATRHLLDLGHREILILTAPLAISSARDRLEGYRNAHVELGIPVDDRLIHQISPTGDDCERIIDRILKEKIPFTAVFAFSDMLAWRLWSHLGDKGYRIPQDFSLVGFDNIQSRMILPTKLDTVSTNKKQFNQKLIQILLEKIRGEVAASRPVQYTLNVRLVVNGTSAPYPTKKDG